MTNWISNNSDYILIYGHPDLVISEKNWFSRQAEKEGVEVSVLLKRILHDYFNSKLIEDAHDYE